MKIIIAGGRNFKPTCSDRFRLIRALKKYKCTEVVSGAAAGADAFGEEIAVKLGIPVKSFPAEWNNFNADNVFIKTNSNGTKYNTLAGFNRNQKMAEYADAVYLFPGGSGTADMLKRAKKHNLKILRDGT